MGFEMKLLPLTAHIQADEMAQVFQGQLTFQLNLEGQRPAAIGTGLRANLHHQLTGFGFGEDQLPSDGEEVVPLRQNIFKIRLIGRQGAGLPDASNLKVKLVVVSGAGVHHPEMGLIHRQMAPHQREHPAEHHCLHLTAIGIDQRAPGELVLVTGFVNPTNNPDGPVLQRFGNRGDGVITH